MSSKFKIENGVLKKYAGNDRDVVIPDGVTSIGEYAFSSCTGLTSITIGNGVTSIGYGAFSGCSGLTSIAIPAGVTSIGDWAFDDCKGLTSITIPNSVTSIGDGAFSGCDKLIEVHNLSSLYVGEHAKHIYKNGESYLHTTDDGYIFYDDGMEVYLMAYTGNQTELTLPENYNGKNYAIYQDAFLWSRLTSITIPNSVTSIGESAFFGCSGLTSITIPDSVTSIGECAFCYCTNLTSITIPFAGKDGAETTPFWKYIIVCMRSYEESVPSLKTVIVTGGTSIGYGAFSGCSGLTSVTIPDSVTSIGYGAFSGCSGLTSITIPDSVTSIGTNAFRDCTGLKAVHITDLTAWYRLKFGNYHANPLAYAHNLYVNGKLVTEIRIPDGIASINDFAYAGGSCLKRIEIPESVTNFGGSIFSHCENVSIQFPSNYYRQKTKIITAWIPYMICNDPVDYAYLWVYQGGKTIATWFSEQKFDASTVLHEIVTLLLTDDKPMNKQIKIIKDFTFANVSQIPASLAEKELERFLVGKSLNADNE